ncbi:MAG: polysaccharide deacetylase family protein, partial [Planctomycetales bacterium]|nr:polysaccharide deacetylase family protein [Planctomycetales bacterium]
GRMPLDLIVTVDTEEEGLWSGTFRSRQNTVANIQEVPRFQQLCDRFGIRPTYLVDWPVLEDQPAVRILDGIQQAGGCEIGAHLHPWCNPPLAEAVTPHETYMCNLTESAQRDKLVALTDRVQQRFGQRPTSFRAGRYGLDATGARLLAELGYRVD